MSTSQHAQVYLALEEDFLFGAAFSKKAASEAGVWPPLRLSVCRR